LYRYFLASFSREKNISHTWYYIFFTMLSSSFYNAIAHVYDSYCETSHINDFLPQELALVEKYNPSSVLEFGIGTGRFAKAYLQRNPKTHYVGVDASKEMLRHTSIPEALLVCDDFKKLYTKKHLMKGRSLIALSPPTPHFIIHLPMNRLRFLKP
jgi:SAM-dependent methyltransferase